MAITKLRKAVNREYDCAACGAKIPVGSQYYDSDNKLTKKPFPTSKYCSLCGQKLLNEQNKAV